MNYRLLRREKAKNNIYEHFFILIHSAILYTNTNIDIYK